ncbi:VWA domain-containing protein [Paramaledivibacter caminithermalis]|jgi:Mg-chelatase subunit ChlD|uniref:Putative glutamine amidotransferase n=1 Tax=Paramaledivibacter caminithermalis (strain DSM 15212 / CIP 107654 / DViRD3) TaxID=1121301 RepID=A0A1M6MVR7_PARC5|nr:VWA domain-containing protein [Paramaledivibacter caminithermalis]SHJ87595.1 Putative glutamine amidotransferase [Paramaledivibacter caminithermalis DSM 15212]
MLSLDNNIGLLIIPLIILGYFIIQGFNCWRQLPFKRKKLWVISRILLILSLAGVLSGMTLELNSKNTTTIFLVDRSLSMKDSVDEIEIYIKNQLSNKKNRDKAAIISFAGDTMIDIPIQRVIDKVNLSSEPNPNFTNIEYAVDFALDYFPKDTNRRLVLITDGRENMGDVASILDRLEDNKINLYVYPLGSGVNQDVQLTSLDIPENIYQRGKIPVTLKLNSNVTSKGTFFLYSKDQQLLMKKLKVNPGENIFKFHIPLKSRKSIEIKGEINFDGDKNLRNNIANKIIEIDKQSKILIVGYEEDIKIINSLVNSAGLDAVKYSPEEVPDNMNFISKFQGVFIVNVPHSRLTSNFENNLKKCVKELGTGLMIVGGENSFALGGYRNTVLEEILPVSCHMKGDKKKPNTGLILAIDCSGSMEDESHGIKKIEMAKEAAIRALEILESKDYLGILAFSDTLEWIVPFGPVDDKESIIHNIEKLSSKGGTLILPGLKKSIEELKHAPVKIKHLILLSDGQGEKKGYEPYFQQMKENKITLSSVAVGSDADLEVLKKLSDNGKGRNYIAKSFETIPKIFAKETYLATKKYINNDEFQAIQVQDTDYFPRLPLPSLKGYIGTGIKENASIILKTPLDDPLLAYWRYGLGKVIAWTSDLNGKWSHEWIKWRGFRDQWLGLINWCISNNFKEKMEVQLETNGGEVKVIGSVASPEQDEYMEIVVLQDSGNLRDEILMDQISLGKYSGKFYLAQAGDYLITVRLKNNDEIIDSLSKKIHLSYSIEYSINNGSGIKKIQSLANIAKGKVINKDDNVFQQPIIKNKSKTDLNFILLPLSLLLFIFDIALRKI